MVPLQSYSKNEDCIRNFFQRIFTSIRCNLLGRDLLSLDSCIALFNSIPISSRMNQPTHLIEGDCLS